jgi:Retinal pigment epithelial membrane protein
MAETLKIPNSSFFEKSPMHTPSRVLKNLDLFNSNGILAPKSPLSDIGHDRARRISKVLMKCDNNRRASLMSNNINFTHTLSDEFAYIQLSVNETRRTSVDSATFYPHALKNKFDNCNKFVIAKVINMGDEDEIEIVDLDDDEDSVMECEIKENYYPNCDVNVWLRSCEREIVDPIEGVVSGAIPEWLSGSLLRNGPGSIKVGNTTFNHLFDSSALLHRFNINDGKVTYQCRFLKSEAYKKNLAANRIVLTEFGTSVTIPDPCQSIFQR